MLRHLSGIVFVIALLLVAAAAQARVGGPCVNCHTMHNSQDGASVLNGTTALQPALLNTTCVGCHSSTDAATIIDKGDGTRIPIVNNATEPDYGPTASGSNKALAGGNFYWVAQGDDAKGHNVYGISDVDQILSTAPGSSLDMGCNDCHSTMVSVKSGCKACHFPAHHADDSAEIVDGAHGSYRFLGDVMGEVFNGWPYNWVGGSDAGVKGIEDDDWEQTVSSSDHNGYSGTTVIYPKSSPFPSPNFLPNGSMGELCAGCHGNFHHQMNEAQGPGGIASVAGAWIRHPSDVIIPDSDEYAAYTEYNPMAPVAKPDLTGQKNSTAVVPGTDLVTCLSCHRSHGSPYPDMLRWDYGKCVTGTPDAECGCFVCHSTKDD